MAANEGIAGRLTLLQKECGFGKSLRAFRLALLDEEFWKGTGKGPPRNFSYEAVRKYHLNRDPPFSYLQAVVQRFDVNPDFLFSGEGAPLMKDATTAEQPPDGEPGQWMWRFAVAGAPEIAKWPNVVKLVFMETLLDYINSFKEVELITSDGAIFGKAVGILASDLFNMVDIEYPSMRPLGGRSFQQYMIALIHAVQIRIPDPEEGPPIHKRFHRLRPGYLDDFRRHLDYLPPEQQEARLAELAADPLSSD